jgi:inorganic pyrophosphatase
MTDESGQDAKILAVPTNKLCRSYQNMQSIDDVGGALKDQIEHFFRYYKDLDEGKWVEIEGWGNAEEAKQELLASYENYQKQL